MRKPFMLCLSQDGLQWEEEYSSLSDARRAIDKYLAENPNLEPHSDRMWAVPETDDYIILKVD